MKKSLFTIAILFAIAGTGCSNNASKDANGSVVKSSEESLGLRKGDLFTEDEVSGVEANYSSATPGTSAKMDRAFTNAPPMVPHEIQDMLPITIKNNQCISCHGRETVKDMKAAMPNLTPIPDTHYKDLRSKDQKDLGHLAGARFNCVQCHAPQANVKPLVENNFAPDYQDESEKHGSNLNSTINVGKDTLKK